MNLRIIYQRNSTALVEFVISFFINLYQILITRIYFGRISLVNSEFIHVKKLVQLENAFINRFIILLSLLFGFNSINNAQQQTIVSETNFDFSTILWCEILAKEREKALPVRKGRLEIIAYGK